MRDDFRATPEYKRVYRKDSFDDWDLPIRTLQAWGILLPDVVSAFRKLKDVRTRAIHFRPEVDANTRGIALEAIPLLRDIVEKQFGALGTQRWFIRGTPGETYLTKAAERLPFIRRVYIPNCRLVGPRHSLTFEGTRFTVHDDYAYEDREVSDDEFKRLRIAGQRTL